MYFDAFADELLKLAYDAPQHAGLARLTSRHLTGGEAAPYVRDTLRAGTLETDKGIRHPWLPTSDPLHSFSGSQSFHDVGRNVAAKQDVAVQDIAHSIAQPGLKGRVLSGARAHRGLKNLGEAHHQMADISAHYEKPVEVGTASPLRERVPTGTGYGGMVPAGREHIGFNAEGKREVGAIDRLKPSATAADRAAVSRSAGFGEATSKKVQNMLVQQHGMHPEEAARRTQEFFSGVKKPNVLSRVVGEVSRDRRYLSGEVSRPLQVAKGLFGSLATHLRA